MARCPIHNFPWVNYNGLPVRPYECRDVGNIKSKEACKFSLKPCHAPVTP